MSHTNVKSEWVDGNLVFKDKSGAEIVTFDGTNRKLSIPSGSAIDNAGTVAFTGTQTFDEIAGNDASLGITGLAATADTGGAVLITGGATTTSGVGGAATLKGGAGSGADIGGAALVTGWVGPPTRSVERLRSQLEQGRARRPARLRRLSAAPLVRVRPATVATQRSRAGQRPARTAAADLLFSRLERRLAAGSPVATSSGRRAACTSVSRPQRSKRPMVPKRSRRPR
jgi:hypothetical protein